MRVGLAVVGGWLSLTVALTPAAGQEPCAALPAPRVVAEGPSSLLQYWVVDNAPWLNEATLPASPALREFRERISSTIDTNARRLLERQVAQLDGGDDANLRLVLSGEAGSLRPMSCLEALLLATQAERTRAQGSSMYDNPTEFVAYVLQRGDTLKVWYYTVDQAGIRGLGTIHGPVEEDVRGGWSPVRSIHNHNFFPDSEPFCCGVTPSLADVESARIMRDAIGVPQFVITNGFDSVEISAAELDRFSGP